MMTLQLGEILRKGVEVIGPILVREISKPRFRRFLEEKAGDVAIELGRRVTTKKSKKFIVRRGGRKMECRMVK